MAKELPYLPSYKNVGELFARIGKAKVPDSFTVRYLADTLGLKSTGDRQLIGLLKKLGFLDNSGKPTPQYSLLKNASSAPQAIGSGVRIAYAPLYEANENAHALPSDQLRGLIGQVSGAEEAMARLINGTFNSLIKISDFTQKSDEPAEDEIHEQAVPNNVPTLSQASPAAKFNPDFRFNIEIHLPSNGSEETYLAIFNALRKSLG